MPLMLLGWMAVIVMIGAIILAIEISKDDDNDDYPSWDDDL
jgi:hypothetical protein